MFLAFKLRDLITVPFGWILSKLYTFTGNYGVAMILFAVVVYMVLLPMTAKSKKSMMKMSRIQPAMQDIQRRYASDQQKMNEAINALVKKFDRKDGVELSSEFEMFSDVQTKIMSMQAYCDRGLRKNDDLACQILIDTADITAFFSEISEIFKLLRPFDDIAEENWRASLKD